MKSHLIRIGGDSMSFLEIIALITLLLKINELTRKRTSTFAALLLPLNFFAIDKKRTA